jgi:competence protein ComEA
MKTIHIVTIAATFLFSSFVTAAPVNINTAAASEIAQALNGVGSNKAEAIVQYRQQNGQFKNASDVVKVKGIGNATYEKNKADILIK